MKYRVFLRILVCPFILGMLLVTYNVACLRRFAVFMRYGGEWINYVEDDHKNINDIYQLLKEKNNETQD